MPSTITRNLRIHNAKQFKEAFSEANDTKMYVFIGKSAEWANASNPPTPADDVQTTEFDIYRTMIAAKKVSQSDVSFVVPRIHWANNTTYAEFQNKHTGLYSNNFYVMTEDFNVYKVIYNNNDSKSVNKPSSTNTSGRFKTGEGYIWKYMYTVTAGDRLKFINNNFIPVQEITANNGSAQYTVQQQVANGTIGSIDVVTRGSGYKNNESTFFSVTNSSVLVANTSANSTSGIYVGSSIFLKSGLGAGQLRQITGYNGTSRTLICNTGFSITPNTSTTYLISPTVTITGDGTGAQAYTEVNSSGNTANVTIVSGGINYSKATVAISANSSHGSGATAEAYVPPRDGHGASALYELGGHNVMINTRLSPSDVAGLSNADFRIIGLLQDPVLANTGVIANTSTLNMTTRINVTAVSGSFTEDERVSGGTSSASGRIILFANSNSTSTTGTLFLNEIEGSFANLETLTANQSSVTCQSAGIFRPEIRDFSGKVLYKENVTKIQRAVDQTEDIKLTVRF